VTASADSFDAVVVGAGPNGLAAAIEIARAGRSVVVLEANDTIGGGCRSAELTLPGFVHDVCSAIHPLALASPFFRSLPLEELGVRALHPEIPLAHPFDDGTAAILRRSVAETAQAFGPDERAYRRLLGPLVDNADGLVHELLGPFRIPKHPIAMARFGLRGLRSAQGLLDGRFDTDAPKALIAGCAAHSILRLDKIPTAAVGLVLAFIAHHVGWPVIEGGSQRLADGLAAYLRDLGGEIRTGTRVNTMNDVPRSKAVLFDLTPRQVVDIAGHYLPDRYRNRLTRFRYGPGVFKIDWALSERVPWKNPDCAQASTVHVGGKLDELVTSELAPWEGKEPERPYVLVGQQSSVDPGRAPEGKHTLWAYCHVPSGSNVDMTERIEAQLERFAPGFKDTVLARHTMSTEEVQAHNSNYIGGDINGGVQDLRQLFTRPVARLNPYTTPNERLYICSSSSPPGGGVHGMCGSFAARAALRHVLR
jgi:phytoene dehydrogenase-like protein